MNHHYTNQSGNPNVKLNVKPNVAANPYASQGAMPYAPQSASPYASQSATPYASQSATPYSSQSSTPYAPQAANVYSTSYKVESHSPYSQPTLRNVNSTAPHNVNSTASVANVTNATQLFAPFNRDAAQRLVAGDFVLLSGEIYAAREAAHRRMTDLLKKGARLQFSLENACIFYAGPCPTIPGETVGPIGPATSARMDAYTPALLGRGVTATIGKGRRSEAVKREMVNRDAVYLAATGGTAALIARHVKSCVPVAFDDLGEQGVFRLTVANLPLIVAVDAKGRDLFEGKGVR